MGIDAIVVGAGLAGGCVAGELCRGGMEVLLLDAGPLLDPDHFGAANAPRARGWPWRVLRAAGGQRIQVRSPMVTPQTCGLYVCDRDNPYETAGAPFLWLRGRQVGGRGHVWGRVVLRWSPREFCGEAGGGAGCWPLGYEDISPYYEELERQLLAEGSDEGCEQVPDGRWSRHRSVGEREKEFLARVGSVLERRRAVPLRIATYAPGPLAPMLEDALATGRLTLRPNTVVQKVVLDAAGRLAYGVQAVDRLSRERLVLRGPRLFITASTIETVRLLLNSRSDRHPDGLGNSSGLLGRYLMDHPCSSVSWPLPGAGAAPTADLLDLAASSGAYLPAPDGSEPGSGRFGVQVYVSETRVSLRAFGEMRPRPENTVSLGARRDRWGVPAARIAMAFDGEDRALLEAQRRLLGEMARLAAPPRAGPLGRSRVRPVSHPAGSAAHECGGVPMGSTPDDSVADPWNRLWDCPNVVVCDASCFRSSGYQNPSLTIMALALRAARRALDSKELSA